MVGFSPYTFMCKPLSVPAANLEFNQQVITGGSIQPFHYEVLIANYAVLLDLVLVLRLFRPELRRRAVLLIVSSCLFCAVIEVNMPFYTRYSLDVKNDEMIPVPADKEFDFDNIDLW